MLQPIAAGHKSLADYTHVAGKPLIAEIRELAAELQGLKVLHLSATAFGGGVSEILYTLVPLMNDVGIEAEWQVMLGREEFYNATKLLHNALQGNPHSLSDEDWQVFDRYNEMNARELTEGWDVVIIHDPQPAGDPPARAGEGARRGSGAATSTCPRPTRTPYRRLVPLVSAYRRRGLPPPGVRARRAWTARRSHIVPTGNRSAVAEEHGLLTRGRRLRVRPVRHRRGPAR